MTHLVTKFILAYIVRSFTECWSGKERVTLSWSDYVKRVAPPGNVSHVIARECWNRPTLLFMKTCNALHFSFCHICKDICVVLFIRNPPPMY